MNWRIVAAALLLLLPAGLAADLKEAVAAMQKGDFLAAEQKLKAELKLRPNEPDALSLLGVALDFQKKFAEAGPVHLKAVALAPKSADVLAGYGDHLLSSGDLPKAVETLGKALAIDPKHLAANRQLGLALAAAGQFEKAEAAFTRALELDPSNFGVLLNLAMVATQAGHGERARDLLAAAQSRNPQNVDVLYRLAWVQTRLGAHEEAVKLLTKAGPMAPKRSDIVRLLATTAAELRAYGDSVTAWDRYMQLEPLDDTARRERGFMNFLNGEVQKGLADLQWYTLKHPQDAMALYQVALAEGLDDPAKGLSRLDAALKVKPDFAAARSERGLLHYQAGRFDEARQDLELAAQQLPDDAWTLDRLGQTYMGLDRTADGLRVLRKAGAIAPGNSTIQLHLGRALASAGLIEESQAAMERFRQLGPSKVTQVPTGLVDYFGMTPEQRQADYRARLEKLVRDNPSDISAQLTYLKLLLAEGEASAEKAAAVARQIPAPQPIGDWLDIAAAIFRVDGAAAGLAKLEAAPVAGRNARFHMDRAEMLEADGRHAEALTSLQEGLKLESATVDHYRQAAAMIVRGGGAKEEVLALMEAATQRFPQDREALTWKAATLAWSGKTQDAQALLDDIRKRWPEWSAAWVVQGLSGKLQNRFDDARMALQNAVGLGSAGVAAQSFLIESALRSTPPQPAVAEEASVRALRIAPESPWIQFIAGRTAFAQSNFNVAAQRFMEAIRLRPTWPDARRELARVYAAMGKTAEADAEMSKLRALPAAAQTQGNSLDWFAFLLSLPVMNW